MFFHDKKVIINIFHMKILDFGKTDLLKLKKKIIGETMTILHTPKGV